MSQRSSCFHRCPRVVPLALLALVTLLAACGAPRGQTLPPTVPPAVPPASFLAVYAATTLADAVAEATHPTTTLSAISAEQGQLLWKTQLAGSAAAAPAVSQDTVYLLTTAPPTAGVTPLPRSTMTSAISAYEARTGKRRWTVEDPKAQEIAAAPGGVLVVDYAWSGSAPPPLSVVALAAADGQPQWTFHSPQSPIGARSLRMFGATAYVVAGVLPTGTATQSTSTVTALQVAAGTQIWQAVLPTGVTGLAADSASVYLSTALVTFSSTTGFLSALDAANGKERWRFQTQAVLLTATPTGTALALQTLRPQPAGVTGPPLLTALALNAADGKQLWNVPTELLTTDRGGTSFAAANQTLFASFGGMPISHSGILALQTSDGHQRWKSFIGHSLTPPVVANGRVYLGLRTSPTDVIEARDASTGGLLWTFQTEGTLQDGVVLGL